MCPRRAKLLSVNWVYMYINNMISTASPICQAKLQICQFCTVYVFVYKISGAYFAQVNSDLKWNFCASAIIHTGVSAY